MKSAFLMFVARVARVTLAVPQELKSSDLDLPAGAYWESEDVLVVRNDILTWEELEEQDRLDDLEAQKLASAAAQRVKRSDNSSISTATDAADIKYFATIRMTRGAQSVGTLRGLRLRNRLIECLSAFCKISDKKDKCYEGKPFQARKCKIPNIVTNYAPINQVGDYGADNHLDVTYRLIQHTPSKTNLDLATYETIGTMYQLMTQLESKCHYVDFKGSRRTKLCSVARKVLLAFPYDAKDDEPETIFIASVTSSVDVPGPFVCDSELKHTISDYFDYWLKPEFAKATGRDEKEIGSRPSCSVDLCTQPKEWKKCTFTPDGVRTVGTMEGPEIGGA